jgi:transposase
LICPAASASIIARVDWVSRVLAKGKMRAKRAELTEALDGRFEDHHGELARMLLDNIDALTAQIDTLTTRITELIEQIPAAWGVDADDTTLQKLLVDGCA